MVWAQGPVQEGIITAGNGQLGLVTQELTAIVSQDR